MKFFICAVASTAAMALAQSGGIEILRDKGYVKFGVDEDVTLERVGTGALLINTTATTINGQVSIADLYVQSSAGAMVSLSEFVQTEPISAGAWSTDLSFGVYGDICSTTAFEDAGLSYELEDGYDVDFRCEDDHFGLWCPGSCTGTVTIPLDYAGAQYVRLTAGVSYDNDSCQGYIHHVSSDGVETELWTHEAGEQVDVFDLLVPFESGDSLVVTETGTCIVDLYNLDVYYNDLGSRVEELEAHVAYLEEALFNQTLASETVQGQCDWEVINTFGSGTSDGLCSVDDMTNAGWTLTDINDDRCNSDNYGPWCGGTCTGTMSYELPDTATAARLVIGHSYGGSCRGEVIVYHTDGSQSSLFTHEEGETFDPERIEFTFNEGDILSISEYNTCIVDLYSLSLLPKYC